MSTEPAAGDAAIEIATTGPDRSSPNYWRMLVAWEHDLPELPPPRDYADYERRMREQLGIDRYTPVAMVRS